MPLTVSVPPSVIEAAPRFTSISGETAVPLMVQLYGFSSRSLLAILYVNEKAPAAVGVIVSVVDVEPDAATGDDGETVTDTEQFTMEPSAAGKVSVNGAVPKFEMV